MTLTLRIVLIVSSLFMLLRVVIKVRKSKVQIENTLFWIGFASILLLFSIFPGIAECLATVLGVYSTSNFVFILIIAILIVHVFSMDIKISQLENKQISLIQEIALKEKKAEKEEK